MYGDGAGKGGGVANAQDPLLQLPALESSQQQGLSGFEKKSVQHNGEGAVNSDWVG